LSYAVQLGPENLFLNDPADGLLVLASALAPAYTPAAGSTLDLVASAIGQLQSGGYTPDGVVLSGVDANAARLLKTTYGEYVWADPGGDIGTPSIWSVPLVISPSMPVGTFLVGAFNQSTILFERQLLTVEISYENEDDFIRNLCTLRGEERVALAVPVPSGLVKGTLPAPGVATASTMKK
jgi:HK97 family phage major capsid protein